MPKLDYQGPFTKKAAFTSRLSHPLLLDLLLIKEFGPEYLAWEAPTVWKEIKSSFGTSISEVNRAKVQALRTCHVVDLPYEAWEIFEKVAISIAGGVPKFDVMQRPTPHACAMALETMRSVRDKKPAREVFRYIAAVMLDDGYCYAPGILEPCNEFLREYTGAKLQQKVKRAVDKNIEPKFDGARDEDTQIAKTRSILDFVEYNNRRLIKQIEVVIKGGS
jgi:hypothetical protein